MYCSAEELAPRALSAPTLSTVAAVKGSPLESSTNATGAASAIAASAVSAPSGVTQQDVQIQSQQQLNQASLSSVTPLSIAPVQSNSDQSIAGYEQQNQHYNRAFSLIRQSQSNIADDMLEDTDGSGEEVRIASTVIKGSMAPPLPSAGQSGGTEKAGDATVNEPALLGGMLTIRLNADLAVASGKRSM